MIKLRFKHQEHWIFKFQISWSIYYFNNFKSCVTIICIVVDYVFLRSCMQKELSCISISTLLYWDIKIKVKRNLLWFHYLINGILKKILRRLIITWKNYFKQDRDIWRSKFIGVVAAHYLMSKCNHIIKFKVFLVSFFLDFQKRRFKASFHN